MDLYQELDVPRDATSELIKQHYRSLAQQHHPDKGGDEERFKAIKKAYEILIDPDKRRLYDEVGEITPGFSLRSEAIGELSECLKGVLPNINLHTESLVKRMRDAVLQKRMHHLTEVNNQTRYITNLKLAISRTRKQSEGDNMIVSFLEQSLTLRNTDLAKATRGLEVSDEMLNILEDYVYDL